MNTSPFLQLQTGPSQSIQLEAQGSWPYAIHVWDEKELDALALAQASRRPLLVRGEPGTGKSQLARAAAALLKWDFRYEVITARHEAQDLLWRFDAVERLANARSGTHVPMQDYVMPGPLWWAINPVGAAAQAHAAQLARGDNPAPSALTETPTPDTEGTVVLIDEIDKADADLPNSLLEVLGNGSFTLPWGAPLQPGRKTDKSARPVLIIITSNEERELPPAFVRRCISLQLIPPNDKDESAFVQWLIDRAAKHFPGMAEPVLQDAARMVLVDRLASPVNSGARPGLAEYLDLLRALDNIANGDADKQKKWSLRLSPYALIKQYPKDQSRGVAHPDPRLG